MNEEVWICEDVGLVLKELREKLDEKMKYYHHLNEDCFYELDSDYYYMEEGLKIAKNILEEVAHNWSVPTDDVINRVKERRKPNE